MPTLGNQSTTLSTVEDLLAGAYRDNGANPYTNDFRDLKKELKSFQIKGHTTAK
jgi:hypothetical protein